MERISSATYFWFMTWVITAIFLGAIIGTVDDISVTIESANRHIFHSWCREHQGEIVTYRNQEICVRNRNLGDRLTMPDYFKIHGRRRD